MSKTNEELIEDLMSLAEGLGAGSEASDVVLQAVARIESQAGRIIDLQAHNSEMGWRLNPDRMGGQFTPEERFRSRDEWR